MDTAESTERERRRPSDIQSELSAANSLLRKTIEQLLFLNFGSVKHESTYRTVKTALDRVQRLEAELEEAQAKPFAVCTTHGIPLEKTERWDWFYCDACERQHGYCPQCSHTN